MKRLLLLLFAVLLSAAVGPVNIPEITGDGNVHQLATSVTYAKWVLFVCPSTNSTTAARIGDSTTAATSGAPCAAGGSLYYPPIPLQFGQPVTSVNVYDLSLIYYKVTNGDKLDVQYGN